MNSHRRLPQQQQQQHKRNAHPPLLLSLIILQLLILAWACVISLHYSSFNSEAITSDSAIRGAPQTAESAKTTSDFELNPLAYEIPGIELKIPLSSPHQDDIQVVYAATASPEKGIALLLHACTHTALKFFSPSKTCPDCVGLSEELRIVRIVMEKGYLPVAVSCVNRKSGCWTEPDFLRVQRVLQNEPFVKYDRVYAIGASSGGSFSAQLLVRGVVHGALVMVMSLGNDVVSKLKSNPKPLFLAPMPRDKRTTSGAIQNYKELKVMNTDSREIFVLDTKSCDSIPVTVSYLQSRVPDITTKMAETLIAELIQAKHLDQSRMLIVDPTRSNWREILSPNNSTHWLDTFALKPGYSPLAKALHRAWAYHEYCSEVVAPALKLFESNSVR